MIGFLRKLFAAAPRTHDGSVTRTSELQPTAGVRSDQTIEALHEEFCKTFCFRPGTNLMDYLVANGLTQLVDWLHWSTPEPEPKSFIRLAVDSARRGEHIWEKQGISMLHEGQWDKGGGPSPESREALSKLARVLGKPIKVYFREKPDGELWVLEFKP